MAEPRMLPWRDPGLVAATALLGVAALVAAIVVHDIAPGDDLRALWLAGRFFEMGRVDEVYPPAGGLFTMLPPEGWVTWIGAENGEDSMIYPFLYPPLWAAVAAAILPEAFAPVAQAAPWINAGLLAATAGLAIRVSAGALAPVAHAALVLLVFTTTAIASTALLQGQPHILVAFLVVLAIERARAGAPVAAGTALALAASLKLFPLLYAAIWLARGERRALVAFAVAGAALAALSVLLAGWPLHRAFLDTVAQIGRTLLLTSNNASFDAVLMQLFWLGDAEVVVDITSRGPDEPLRSWFVLARPAGWAAAANAALIAGVAAIALAARRATPEQLYGGLWPAMLAVTVLFAPTGWIYYLIPAAVFAPVLVARLPRPRGIALFLAGYLLFFAGRVEGLQTFIPIPAPETLPVVAGALVWALGFVLVARDGVRLYRIQGVYS